MAITHAKTSGSIPPKINGTDWDADHVGSALRNARYPVQEKMGGWGNQSAPGVTLDATPTVGNILLAFIIQEGATNVNSISQTNVTWTKLAESAASTAPHVELWKGVISSSPGTTATATLSGTTWSMIGIHELDNIAGTLDDSAVLNTSVRYIPKITVTDPDAYVVTIAAMTANSANFVSISSPHLMSVESFNFGIAWGFPGVVQPVGLWVTSGVPSGLLTASII